MHPLNLATQSIPISVTTGYAFCSLARYVIRSSDNNAYESVIGVPLRLFAFNSQSIGRITSFQYVTVAREDALFGPNLYNPYYAFGVRVKDLVPLL
jgi:hypothetical protein